MITSETNDRVKQVAALQSRRHARRKANRFVVEGVRLVGEAVLTQAPVEEVYYTEHFAADAPGLELLDGLSALGAQLMMLI